MVEMSDEMHAIAEALAQRMADTLSDAPIICGLAAVTALTGHMCFLAAEGDVETATKRADGIAAGVKDVIQKLHQEESGNGRFT